MKVLRLTLLLIFMTQSILLCFAQKKFKIEISFPDTLSAKNVNVVYDNGKNISRKRFFLKNGQLTLSDSFYSRYAAIFIYKSGEGFAYYYNSYFVGDLPVKLSFKKIDTVNKKLIFEHKNAYELGEMGEAKLKLFDAKEEEDFLKFGIANQVNFARGDSVAFSELNKKSKTLSDKKLEFIKLNNKLYYSFWLFRSDLARNFLISPDSLLAFYKKTFSSTLKNSEEGNEILTILHGRMLSSVSHSLAPDFTSKDINGKKISLKDFRGKYVLLNLWATWCLPCVQELPSIRKIRNSTSENKLEIISISYDRNMQDFMQGIEKYSMNWTHIYYDDAIRVKYAGTALPMLYLIDDKGRIVYNRDSDEKDGTNLSSLQKLIEAAHLQ